MTLVAGIDIGAVSTKAVLLQNSAILSYEMVPSKGNYREAAARALEAALAKAGLALEAVSQVGATGVGAANVPFPHRQLSEIACHGKGINFLFPSARTVIDIGGQGSRAIRIDPAGSVIDFAVSDKCAAGSGRFLELMAKVLQVNLEEMGELSLASKKVVRFNTGCAVFAESEAISRIAEGAAKEDILAGVHEAMASTLYGLVERVRLERDCALTGGGARDIGLVEKLRHKMGIPLLIPQEPRLTAALGAALMVRDKPTA